MRDRMRHWMYRRPRSRTLCMFCEDVYDNLVGF